MTTAFVLSGGANLGAVQVGMLLGLADAGIVPDVIVGTSVGAINGAWMSSRPDADGIAALAALWRSLSRHDVFPTRPLTGLFGFLGRRRNLIPNTGLRRLLADHVKFTNLEDAPIPLHVIATDVLTGEDVRLSSGDAVDAILASAAIPGIFPPIEIAGRHLIDGGVVNNTPLCHAVALEADEIWVLPTGYACALSESPDGVLAMVLHALSLTVNQRLAVEVRHFEGALHLRVVPPLCPIQVSPIDFSQTGELIDRSYESTREWLMSSPPRRGQAKLVEPHGH